MGYIFILSEVDILAYWIAEEYKTCTCANVDYLHIICEHYPMIVFQAIGSVVSMYLLSGKLTAIMLATVPGMVLGGALIGSSLRGLSKMVQQQVCRGLKEYYDILGESRPLSAFSPKHADFFTEMHF